MLTVEGEAKPVAWLGRQTVSRRFADPLRVMPIRIMAGALGDNVPLRDLRLSPDHALLVDGVLIQAGALVNGTSIIRESGGPERFTYYHVGLADHALILAEGAPAETFIDNVDRLAFDNWEEHLALYPEGKKWKNCLSHARSRTGRFRRRSVRASSAAPRLRCLGPPPERVSRAGGAGLIVGWLAERRASTRPLAPPSRAAGKRQADDLRPQNASSASTALPAGRPAARNTRRRKIQLLLRPLPQPPPSRGGGSNALKSAGFLPPPLEGGGWGEGSFGRSRLGAVGIIPAALSGQRWQGPMYGRVREAICSGMRMSLFQASRHAWMTAS